MNLRGPPRRDQKDWSNECRVEDAFRRIVNAVGSLGDSRLRPPRRLLYGDPFNKRVVITTRLRTNLEYLRVHAGFVRARTRAGRACGAPLYLFHSLLAIFFLLVCFLENLST